VIAILLSTYNGADWLPALLWSIHRQTNADWQLLARDDGSVDNTQRVLTVAAWRDRRIVPVRDVPDRLGPLGSFNHLMRYGAATPARYFAVADQDDVWLPEKLERLRSAISEMESVHGADTPLLVHSDARIIDGMGRPVHGSLARYLGLRRSCRRRQALPTLLARNFVTSCTALFNRALLEAAMPLPGEAIQRDWWLALCAAAAGHVHYLPFTAVEYRLHPFNIPQRIGSRLAARRRLRSLRQATASAAQARALADRLRTLGRMNRVDSRTTLDRYWQLFTPAQSRWRRAWGICRLGQPGMLNRLLFAGVAGMSATLKNEIPPSEQSIALRHMEASPSPCRRAA